MPFIEIVSPIDFETTISLCNSLAVVKFFATWHPAYINTSLKFKQLSSQFPALTFTTVNIDKLQSISNSFHVKAVPTYLILYKGNVITRLEGSRLTELEKRIRMLYQQLGKPGFEKFVQIEKQQDVNICGLIIKILLTIAILIYVCFFILQSLKNALFPS